MVGMILVAALGLCLGGIIWKRRQRRQTGDRLTAPAAIPRETLALQAFAHGNRRLAAGRFDEASAAFQHVLALNPKHPQVAGRLAEVTRQQRAARGTPPK